MFREDLEELPGPYELLELADRGSLTVWLKAWERGSMIIHPRYEGAPPEKKIPVLRVHVADDFEKLPPRYYDVTSKTLMAQWLPMLSAADFRRYKYTVTKFGVPPRARFTLERVPL